MQNSVHAHEEQEPKEVAVVEPPYTVVEEGAVVIEAFDTVIANSGKEDVRAMGGSVWPPDLTGAALLLSVAEDQFGELCLPGALPDPRELEELSAGYDSRVGSASGAST